MVKRCSFCSSRSGNDRASFLDRCTQTRPPHIDSGLSSASSFPPWLSGSMHRSCAAAKIDFQAQKQKACAVPGQALNSLVRSRRLELPRVFTHSDLNAARLPVPPRPLVIRRRREYQIGQSQSSGSGPGLTELWGLVQDPMEWRVDDRPIAYEAALALMDQRVADIRAGSAG